MIQCTFVYMFAKGGSSDSLREVHEVQVVPRIGDAIFFGDNRFIVKAVDHIIDRAKGHEIVVYYGGDDEE